MADSDPVVVGYWYKAGFHFVPCYGPVDALLQVRVGDRIAWDGDQDDSGNIPIYQPGLFGGESREGGLQGTLKVKMGWPTQTNADFKGSGVVPAYRGVLSLLWSGFYAALNPYMKPWAFKVKRILRGWHNDSCWYPAKAVVTIDGVDNMNPAHVLYQCLTDPEWGMGYPTSAVDDAKFTAAADTLYDEGFGVSLTWNQQGKCENFINEVLDHVQSVVRHDPQTGKFVLKLVRDDYDPDSLQEFDASNIIDMEEFARVSWGETVNEITVKYVDQQNGRVSAVTVHDLANIQSQGFVISRTQQYAGIGNYALAQRVAMRDLKMASSPLAKYRMRVNRMGWNLLPGDVCKVSYPKLGIESVILRIMECSLGKLESNEVTVIAMEDVFALPDAVYVAQEPVGWEDPSSEPAEAPTRYITETAYYTLSRNLSRADMSVLTGDDCYLSALAEKPSGDALSYKLWTRTGSDDFVNRGSAAHCPTASLVEAIGKIDTAFAIEDGINLEVVRAGTYAYIVNAGTKYEAVRVDAITDDAIVVARGVLDTVPVAHDAGARIFFAQGFEGTDRVTYLPTETVDTKIQTRTGRGELEILTADIASVTMDQRQHRPYPPGLFRINTEAYPTTITGELTVSWAHRDRLQQTATIIEQDESDIGPEAGTTYTLEIYGDGGALKHTLTGLTGTTYTLTEATEKAANGGSWNSTLRVVVKAVRDGLDSWTYHEHTVPRAGLGTYHADAIALFARFTTDPGSTRKTLIDDFIKALDAAGVWAKLDSFYVFAAHEEDSALLDWKRGTKVATLTGATFTIDTGGIFTGASGERIAPDFTPAVHGSQYTRNKASMIVDVDGVSGDGYLCGAIDGSNATMLLHDGISAQSRVNSSAVSSTMAAVTGADGFYIVQRTSSTAQALYKNGTKLDSSAGASSVLLNKELYIGDANGGTVGSLTGTVRMAGFGASLTKDQRDAFKAARDAYLAGL